MNNNSVINFTNPIFLRHGKKTLTVHPLSTVVIRYLIVNSLRTLRTRGKPEVKLFFSLGKSAPLGSGSPMGLQGKHTTQTEPVLLGDLISSHTLPRGKELKGLWDGSQDPCHPQSKLGIVEKNCLFYFVVLLYCFMLENV